MSTLTLIPADDIVSDTLDAEALHKEVMAMFRSVDLDGSEREKRVSSNILWRREKHGLLVRSDIQPTNLPLRARTKAERAHPFAEGERVTFEVAVTPVKRNGNRETSLLHYPEREAPEPWGHVLARFLDGKFGAALSHVEVWHFDYLVADRKGAKIVTTSILGEATVADAGELQALLTRGVGRGLAYGCGLLTVQPA